MQIAAVKQALCQHIMDRPIESHSGAGEKHSCGAPLGIFLKNFSF